MAIQLQIRRGTTAQNESFIGAAGEISLDTDTMTLRIHDGQHAGGFVIPTIVAEQKPTADNNYTWYKKYSNGWVEQGGVFTNSTNLITFPVAMANTKYTCVSGSLSDDGNAVYNIQFYSITTTGFSAKTVGSNDNWTGGGYPSGWWQVSGMAA